MHVISKNEDDKYKSLKTIDFCGGHYPTISSGPLHFTIDIPSIEIKGTNKKIPSETWVLENDNLVKKKYNPNANGSVLPTDS